MAGKAYISTMGCPKNLVDSEAAAAILGETGYVLTDEPSEADLLLVGACSFLQSSWRETVEEVERLARFKRPKGVDTEPGSRRRLVLMGCLPRHRKENLETELADVDHFLPTGAHEKLSGLVEQWWGARDGRDCPDATASRIDDAAGVDRFAAFEKRILLTPPHMAYVKIAEGCNRHCSFCAIPAIRGRQITRPVSSIVREVEGLVERGVKEITLLSQDIVSYKNGGTNFVDLVDEISRTGVDWIRLFYLHPVGLTLEDVRRLFEHPSVVRYLELPIQHVSNRILDRMRRSHDRNHLERLIGGIRAEFPETVVRSEVIVGFPGETEDEFEELLSFVEEIEFDSLGVFPYSREPGTEAGEFAGQAARPLIRHRVDELTQVQDAVSFGVQSRRIGRRYTVLVDRKCDPGERGTSSAQAGCEAGCYAGRYYGQALDIDGEVFVEHGESDDIDVGEFVRVRITGNGTHDLNGELLESPLFLEES